jgi:hypothetical protein
VFGFCDLDLIAFHDPFNPENHLLFWINSLRVGYSDLNSLIEVSTMLTRDPTDSSNSSQ